MKSKRTRLDRLIGRYLGINRREVRLILARGRVSVNGRVARDVQQLVDEFDQVVIDENILQDKTPRYYMMNKPAGVVSATEDNIYQTVIDLLNEPDKQTLHIVGRLDFNSTGLLLLTDDGRWSRQLSQPEKKIGKCYRVVTKKPLTDDYCEAFRQGMYFAYEDIITQPAELRIISDFVAEVTLTEGKYHQVKRMFGQFDNKVLQLHRVSVGNLMLDENLKPGSYRQLSQKERQTIY